jgi:hypothetical protein
VNGKAVMPAKAGIQHSSPFAMNPAVEADWIIRLRG